MKPLNSACRATIIALALATLSACGQRGPLYLPKPETPAGPAKATQSPAPTPSSLAPAGDAPSTPAAK